MALVFVDGFDAGDALIKYTSYVSGSSSTSTRFSSGRCWTAFYLLTKLVPTSGEIFVGAAWSVGSFASVPYLTLQSDSATTTHMSLTFTSTTVQIRRGANNGTVIESQSYVLTAGWHYVEFAVLVHSTTGTASVRVDGQTIASFSGNTRVGGTSTNIDGIMFGNGNAALAIDDLYVADNTGPAPYNTFLGDIRIHSLVPNAAGSFTQMTPSTGANYTTVDELPYSATDYVRGSAGQTDLYTASDLPAGVGTIYGVQANAIAKKTDAGSLSGRTVLKSGATTVYSANKALSSGDVVITDTRSLNPDTTAAWTTGDINAVEVGIGAV